MTLSLSTRGSTRPRRRGATAAACAPGRHVQRGRAEGEAATGPQQACLSGSAVVLAGDSPDGADESGRLRRPGAWASSRCNEGHPRLRDSATCMEAGCRHAPTAAAQPRPPAASVLTRPPICAALAASCPKAAEPHAYSSPGSGCGVRIPGVSPRHMTGHVQVTCACSRRGNRDIMAHPCCPHRPPRSSLRASSRPSPCSPAPTTLLLPRPKDDEMRRPKADPFPDKSVFPNCQHHGQRTDIASSFWPCHVLMLTRRPRIFVRSPRRF
jgi:hypothetical protein